MLASNNTSGFPFGIAFVGKVILKSTTSFVEVIPDSCYILNLSAKEQNLKYKLNQNITINPTDELSLSCIAVNNSQNAISATPSTETRYRTNYGDIVESSTISGKIPEAISFGKGEKKEFTFILPIAREPQFYNAKVSLVEKDMKSNSLNVNYNIAGNSATVDNVSIDKDFYQKGDIATLSLLYRSSGGVALTSNVSISNATGKSCANSKSQPLVNDKSSKVDISIPIKANCIDPVVVLSLVDEKGDVLATKELKVKTTSAPTKEPSKSKNPIFIILIFVLFVAVLLMVVLKRRNPPTPPTQDTQPPEPSQIKPEAPTNILSIIIPFFFLLSLFALTPISTISAWQIKTYASTIPTNLNGGTVNIVPQSLGGYPAGCVTDISGTSTNVGQTIKVLDNSNVNCWVNLNVVSSPGYYIQWLFVDGIDPLANATGPAKYGTFYTTAFVKNSSGSHSIDALFSPFPSVTRTSSTGGSIVATYAPLSTSGTKDTWSITSIPVYTITPSAGYTIKTLTVDGWNQIIPTSSGMDYTFSYASYISDHTISATFVPLPTVKVYANGRNPETVTSGGLVIITWNSENTTSCQCKYIKDDGTDGDCGTGTTGNNQGGMSLTLAQSKTFTVTCTDE